MRRLVTVTVADSHAGALDDLAGRLAQAGMQVEQVLGVLGVVTGRLEDEQLAAIARLPGVAAVEEQATYGLAPPDAEIQ
jgi:hypothetical protein